MDTNILPKKPLKFCCEICDFTSGNKKDFDRHLTTLKHKTKENDTNDILKTPKKPQTCYNCINCNKSYKYASGLYRHKKKCNFHELPIIDNSNTQLIIKELILEVVKQQQEHMIEFTNTIKELIPKVGNNIIQNNNNTINQKFNIQVFLNEKCKDAINMSDFIKSIEVSFQQLDYTKQNGLVNGLSNVIIEHMNKLGLYQRPIHCTDLKRESLYIKEDDIWIKDITKENIKKAIKGASTKQFCALSKWTKENPDFLKNDSKQDYYTHTLVAIANNKENNEDKIIKKLCISSFVKE